MQSRLPVLAAALLASCASRPDPFAGGPRAYEPSPAWPADWRPVNGRVAPPTDVPRIDLSVDNHAARYVVSAETIDTRDFPAQHRRGAPWTGPTARPGTLLPPHAKPGPLPGGPPNDLHPAGLLGGSRTGDISGFEGIAQTPWRPPDPTIAVGPDHVVVTVNMAVAFYTRDGVETFSANLDSTGDPGFFEGEGAGDFTFDPKCYYDPTSGRFVIIALEYYDTNEAWVDIAVSDDSDPNGTWFKYRTWAVVEVGDSTYWVDYPGFGWDEDAFYVTGNLFLLEGNGSGFAGALYRVFPKSPLLAGDDATVFDVRRGGHASVQAAHHHDTAAAAYFVSRRDSSRMRISAVLSPTTAPSVEQVNVDVPSFSSPGSDAPNPGGAIDTLDGRIMNVHYRNGSLLAAHAVDGGDRTVSRWYRFDVGNWPVAGSPILAESGEINTPSGVHNFFPAVAANRHGDIALVCAMADANTYPSIQVTGRHAADPPGSMGSLQQAAIGDAGSDGRWGDYFDLTTDPTNDVRFWFVGEYARDYGWQTYVGSFVVTCVEDLDANGSVDIGDLLAVIAAWGSDGDAATIAAPYDIVDVSDLLGLIGAFGTCPN